MRKILIAIFCLVSVSIFSQELDFNVKVIASPAISQADPRIFKTLERTITEFVNNNKWTQDEYEEEERIKGSIQITVTGEASSTSFTADMLIQSTRPVFNSDYTTQVLNFNDDNIPFSYVEMQPLENNVNEYKDNLSSVLLYYIHYILGMDYDSFSAFGGEKYFQICQTISNSIPPNVMGADKGWDVSSDRSRAKMIESILSPRSRKIREATYNYHRHGLDVASNDLGLAKATILSALKDVQAVNASTPNWPSVQMFMDSKRSELVEIFIQSDRGQLSQIYNILMEIDPSQSNVYNKLRS